MTTTCFTAACEGRAGLIARARRVGMSLLLAGVCIGGLLPAVANAKDPCKMVFCMWGKYSKTTGQGDDGGSKCAKAEAEYFSILVYRKKGRIDWSATARERLKAQNSCSTADRGKTKEINRLFGQSRG